MECANTGLKTVCLTGSDGSAVRLWGLRRVKDGDVVLVVAKPEGRPSIRLWQGHQWENPVKLRFHHVL